MRRLLMIPFVLLLASCSLGEEPDRTAEPSPSETEEIAASLPPADEEIVVEGPDDMAACAEVSELLLPVQDVVTALIEDPSGNSIDLVPMFRTANKLREIQPLVSSRMNTYFAPFSSVVLQLDDVVAERVESPTSFDTGAYRDGAIGLIMYCADEVGYTAP